MRRVSIGGRPTIYKRNILDLGVNLRQPEIAEVGRNYFHTPSAFVNLSPKIRRTPHFAYQCTTGNMQGQWALSQIGFFFDQGIDVSGLEGESEL